VASAFLRRTLLSDRIFTVHSTGGHLPYRPGFLVIFGFWGSLMSINWFFSRLVYNRAFVSGQDLAVSLFSVLVSVLVSFQARVIRIEFVFRDLTAKAESVLSFTHICCSQTCKQKTAKPTKYPAHTLRQCGKCGLRANRVWQVIKVIKANLNTCPKAFRMPVNSAPNMGITSKWLFGQGSNHLLIKMQM